MTDSTGAISADLERASVLCDLGRHDEAAAFAGQVIAANPDVGEAWCLLSRAELGRGDDDAALRAALKAVPLAPEAEWPHRLASIALGRLDRPLEAVWRAREAVRLDPHGWRTHAHLARTLSEEPADRDEARVVAARAIELGPDEAETHLAAGAVAFASNRRDEADAAYRRALAIDPQNSAAHNDLARVHLRKVNIANPSGMAAAATGFATAVRADPRAAVSRRNLDMVLRTFLSRVAYFIFLDAYFVVRLAAGSSTPAARLLPVAALAVPAGFAWRFLVGLAPPLRRHTADLIRHNRPIRAAAAFEAVAVACLLAGSVAAGGGHRDLGVAAALTALAGRLILYSQARAAARR